MLTQVPSLNFDLLSGVACNPYTGAIDVSKQNVLMTANAKGCVSGKVKQRGINNSVCFKYPCCGSGGLGTAGVFAPDCCPNVPIPPLLWATITTLQTINSMTQMPFSPAFCWSWGGYGLDGQPCWSDPGATIGGGFGNTCGAIRIPLLYFPELGDSFSTGPNLGYGGWGLPGTYVRAYGDALFTNVWAPGVVTCCNLMASSDPQACADGLSNCCQLPPLWLACFDGSWHFGAGNNPATWTDTFYTYPGGYGPGPIVTCSEGPPPSFKIAPFERLVGHVDFFNFDFWARISIAADDGGIGGNQAVSGCATSDFLILLPSYLALSVIGAPDGLANGNWILNYYNGLTPAGTGGFGNFITYQTSRVLPTGWGAYTDSSTGYTYLTFFDGSGAHCRYFGTSSSSGILGGAQNFCPSYPMDLTLSAVYDGQTWPPTVALNPLNNPP